MEKRKHSRRKNRRVSDPLPILIFWSNNTGRFEAYLSDISVGGCYLNTNAELKAGEEITVEIPSAPAAERVIKFKGTVIPQPRKLKGFGVKFDALNEEQQSLVVALLVQTTGASDRRNSNRNLN